MSGLPCRARQHNAAQGLSSTVSKRQQARAVEPFLFSSMFETMVLSQITDTDDARAKGDQNCSRPVYNVSLFQMCFKAPVFDAPVSRVFFWFCRSYRADPCGQSILGWLRAKLEGSNVPRPRPCDFLRAWNSKCAGIGLELVSRKLSNMHLFVIFFSV